MLNRNRKTRVVPTLLSLSLLTCLASHAAFSAGPDVILSNIPSVASYGPVNGIRAYALGSGTCNIGNQNLEWVNNGSPGLAMNAFRLHDGRLTQIGLSFAKTACCAVNTTGCGMGCSGGSSSALGVGCKDTYSAGWNASQGRLAPRSVINPYSGAFGSFPALTGDAIFRRLQIAESDLNPTNFPGALYFVEGLYASTGDAGAQNWHNNATYQRATFNTSYQLALAGAGSPTVPAISAWRDHGNGVNTPDLSVNIINVDVPNEGRFIAASKVRNNNDGTWRYDYAVYNLNSHQSGGTFSVPAPASVTVTNMGFSDVNYHSGELYSGTDWTIVRDSQEVRWSTQTFAQNANANALRWGTMYNFWFTADREPTDFGKAEASLGLFRPGPVMSVAVATQGPKPSLCAADVSPPGGSGAVDVNDLLAVIDAWGPCARCVEDINGDGDVNVNDLLAVINNWGACP